MRTMIDREHERAAFEALMTDGGKWNRAVERNSQGAYVLAQTASAWQIWCAALAHATANPQLPPLNDVMYHAFRGYELEVTSGGDESTTVYLDDSVLDEIWENINTALRCARHSS